MRQFLNSGTSITSCGVPPALSLQMLISWRSLSPQREQYLHADLSRTQICSISSYNSPFPSFMLFSSNDTLKLPTLSLFRNLFSASSRRFSLFGTMCTSQSLQSASISSVNCGISMSLAYTSYGRSEQSSCMIQPGVFVSSKGRNCGNGQYLASSRSQSEQQIFPQTYHCEVYVCCLCKGRCQTLSTVCPCQGASSACGTLVPLLSRVDYFHHF